MFRKRCKIYFNIVEILSYIFFSQALLWESWTLYIYIKTSQHLQGKCGITAHTRCFPVNKYWKVRSYVCTVLNTVHCCKNGVTISRWKVVPSWADLPMLMSSHVVRHEVFKSDPFSPHHHSIISLSVKTPTTHTRPLWRYWLVGGDGTNFMTL